MLKVLSERPGVFGAVDLQALGPFPRGGRGHGSRDPLNGPGGGEARPVRSATQDSLTGLGNRALFYDRFHQGLKLARRQGRRMGIALIDMDGLKRINDSCGHQAGDTALRTLARLGGDEFAILGVTVNDPDAARD